MKTTTPLVPPPALPGAPSAHALANLMSRRGEPLLIADWEHTLMIHYEIEPERLRPYVPFPLDLHHGKAYVTLVAFTMRGMRPRWGGWLGKLLVRPIGTHAFLNVRTYVKVGDEVGIHFITEYMNNVLSLKLGPLAFGLPYRYARFARRDAGIADRFEGRIADRAGTVALAYRAALPHREFRPAAADTFSEWLMERYTAFLAHGTRRLFFRVWHPPWPEVEAEVHVTDDTLLRRDLPWFKHARFVGANFSPGVHDAWMGAPHRVA